MKEQIIKELKGKLNKTSSSELKEIIQNKIKAVKSDKVYKYGN